MCIRDRFIIPFLINSNELWGQEQFSRTGYQWSIDSVSFFSLIRETDNTFNNYYTCTEKTFRCLFNGQAPIFTHGRDIVLNDFEDLGFQINKSLINYDYLKEENLVFKLQRLQQELDRLRTISFDNWNSLWLDNYEMFKYNSDYLRHDYKNAIIYPRLDNYFK